MSEQQRHDIEEKPARSDVENAVIAADDTGMVSNEADIVNAEIREAIGLPNGGDRTG